MGTFLPSYHRRPSGWTRPGMTCRGGLRLKCSPPQPFISPPLLRTPHRKPGPPGSSPPTARFWGLFPQPASLAPRPAGGGTLTQTLVGVLCRAAGPRAVLEEGQTTLAVHSRCVVLTAARQLTSLVGPALTGVAIAFAPEGNAGRKGPGDNCHRHGRGRGQPSTAVQVWAS